MYSWQLQLHIRRLWTRVASATCPVQGRCKTDCVVYRATVKEIMSGSMETYTGVTGNTFKERWYGHRGDMRNEKKRLSSRLSSHIWDLKDERKDFEVKWSLIDRSTSFNPITRKCRICLKEKYQIMYNGNGSSLNKRQEIFNTCRHRTQKLLVNVKSWVQFSIRYRNICLVWYVMVINFLFLMIVTIWLYETSL